MPHRRRFVGKCNVPSLAMTRPCTIIVRDKYGFEVCTEIFSYRFPINYAFFPRLVCNLKRLRIVDGSSDAPRKWVSQSSSVRRITSVKWTENRLKNDSCFDFFFYSCFTNTHAYRLPGHRCDTMEREFSYHTVCVYRGDMSATEFVMGSRDSAVRSRRALAIITLFALKLTWHQSLDGEKTPVEKSTNSVCT